MFAWLSVIGGAIAPAEPCEFVTAPPAMYPDVKLLLSAEDAICGVMSAAVTFAAIRCVRLVDVRVVSAEAELVGVVADVTPALMKETGAIVVTCAVQPGATLFAASAWVTVVVVY